MAPLRNKIFHHLQDMFTSERKTLRGASTCPPHKRISQLTEEKVKPNSQKGQEH